MLADGAVLAVLRLHPHNIVAEPKQRTIESDDKIIRRQAHVVPMVVLLDVQPTILVL